MKNRIIWLILALLFPLTIQAETSLPVLDPNSTNLAKFFLSINASSFFDPDFFYADIKIDTASNTINALSLSFSYDTEKLELIEGQKNEDLCEFVIVEKNDLVNGNYTLLCGTSQPSLATSSMLISLAFTKKQSGLARININSESAFYLASEFGERISTIPENHNIYLLK